MQRSRSRTCAAICWTANWRPKLRPLRRKADSPNGSTTCAAKGEAVAKLTKSMLPFACLALLACVSVPGASASGAPEQRAFGPIQPRLSPDGQQIALSWQGAICRMPASDGALTVLTRGAGFDLEPAWSPDGNTIAFINSANFFGGQLQWINAEDGSPRKLPAAVRAQGRLEFHPDRKRLLG